MDKQRIKQTEVELAKLDENHSRVQNQLRELSSRMKEAERNLEAKRQEIKSLQTKINFKKTLR